MNKGSFRNDNGAFSFYLVLCFILLVATIVGLIRDDRFGALMCFVGFWGSQILSVITR